MPLEPNVPFNLYNFRQVIGDPARSYLYLVHIPEVGTDQVMTAMAKSTSLPAYTLGDATIAFQGMNINLASPPTIPEVTFTFLCDEAHELRRIFLKWQSLAYDVGTGSLGHSNTYKSDRMGVSQLARNGQVVCRYGFVGAYPKTVAEIAVGHENQALESFDVQFKIDYYIIVDQNGEQTMAAPMVRSNKSIKVSRGSVPPANSWRSPFTPQ